MQVTALQPGDVVFASQEIYNDGSLPGVAEGALLASAGQRGVIINMGHLEADPSQVLVLVRFEDAAASHGLGPAVACWPGELSALN